MRFAEQVLRWSLIPWQEWALVHGLELHPDGSGRPRFRTIVLLVARQNGKTQLLVLLALWWLYVARVPLVLGTSTNLDYARESWERAVQLAEELDDLRALIPKNGVRRANGEQELRTTDRARYKIATASRRGGRSLTVHRLIGDELREHHSWEALGAAEGAMNAVPDAQAWLLSNAGDDKSIVLNSLRDTALQQMTTGADEPIGLFEWSAPDGCALDDEEAWAQANPALGVTITRATLSGQAARAAADPEFEPTFRTEALCQRVAVMNAAVSPARWAECADPRPLDDLRDGLALCVDVAPDAQHATAVVAVVDGERVRVEVVGAWSGPRAGRDLAGALPDLVRRVRPRVLGWFPDGPAAALADELTPKRTRAGGRVEPVKRLHGALLQPVTTEVATACVSFAEAVQVHTLAHPDDPLLTAHVLGADRQARGDRWVFSRRGSGHVDAAYAAAGAVHLARTMPKSVGRVRIITAE